MATVEIDSALRDLRLLNVRQLGKLLGCSPRNVWRLLALGKLPEPLRLGARTVRWRVREIEAWLDGARASA